MERWKQRVESAKIALDNAQSLIDGAAQDIAKKLGFKNYRLFSAVFAGRGDVVLVTFDTEGAQLELDIETMAGMTKKQVQDEFETVLAADVYSNLY